MPLVLLALLALSQVPAAQASTPDWTKADPETVLGERDMVVDIDFAEDGSIWFIELEGTVSRYDPATQKVETKLAVDNVVTGGERGMVGFALAKDHATTGTFFVYYTERTDDPDGGINRLQRVTGTQRTTLLSVSGAEEHNGGRIVVDDDGNLFVGTGENQLRDPAQDLDSNLGKILHLKPDGSPAPGNMQGLVYSYGHRNPFGLALHPTTGELWETENSGWRRDEVNIVKPGGNYGYPECEGLGLNGVSTPCPTNKGYTFPVRTFYENDAVAPTGAAFWRGEFYWASLNEGSIHHLWQDPDTKEWHDAKVLEDQAPILDLAVGPDDALYFSTTDGILRVALADVDVGNSGGDSGETQVESTTDAPAPTIKKPAPTSDTEERKGLNGATFAFVILALGVGMMAGRQRR